MVKELREKVLNGERRLEIPVWVLSGENRHALVPGLLDPFTPAHYGIAPFTEEDMTSGSPKLAHSHLRTRCRRNLNRSRHLLLSLPK